MDRLASTNNDSFTTQNSDDPSWSTSMESPLVRLNREITNFSIQDNVVPSSSSSRLPPTTQVEDESDYPSQEDTSIGIIPPSAKGKGKDTSHPLLKNVLRHNLYSASDNSSFDSQKVSPVKFRGKPKTPIIDKRLNPYLRPSDASGGEWSGVVDLRDPSMRTPQRYRSGKSLAAASGKTPKTPYTDDDDDSFDGLPPGMSPPVLMSPARPPRSSAELGLLKLGQTPARDASARIQRDLLRDVQLKSGGRKQLFRATSTHQYESSMSTVPTPPSLSRYNRHGHDYSSNSSITKDSSLESMIKRIRADLPSTEPASYVDGTALAGAATTPGLRVRPRAQQASQNAAQLRAPEPLHKYTESPITPAALAPPPHPDYFDDEPITPVYNPHNEQDLDSDSDSLDEINNTAHPSAAFLMASQGVHVYDDDSFGSNHSSDSLENELDHANIGLVPVHPFAANAVEDDGFDEDDDDSFVGNRNGAYEETVFGMAPAQRQQSAAAQARLSNGEGLRMLGEDLLQDTIGIGSHIAATGGVEESPTPGNWG
jgi:DASH complex subunit ASK1